MTTRAGTGTMPPLSELGPDLLVTTPRQRSIALARP